MKIVSTIWAALAAFVQTYLPRTTKLVGTLLAKLSGLSSACQAIKLSWQNPCLVVVYGVLLICVYIYGGYEERQDNLAAATKASKASAALVDGCRAANTRLAGEVVTLKKQLADKGLAAPVAAPMGPPAPAVVAPAPKRRKSAPEAPKSIWQ